MRQDMPDATPTVGSMAGKVTLPIVNQAFKTSTNLDDPAA